MASARSSCKDLLERISPGSPQGLPLRTYLYRIQSIFKILTQGLLVRTWTGSPESPQDLLRRIFTFRKKTPRGFYFKSFSQGPRPRTTTYTLREPEQSKCACPSLFENLQVKCRRPNSRDRLCPNLGNRNAHGHVRRTHFMPKFTEKMPEPRRNPDQAPAFTLTVRSPQFRHTVWQ